MTAGDGAIRYGTAGWSFPDWYGPFYPQGPAADEGPGPGSLFTGVLERPADPDVRLARRRPLVYYARWFDAVEVNSSFYGTPRAETATRWLDATEERPPGARPFLFSLKLPQLFTHRRDLDPREVEAFADCLRPLEERGRLAGVLAQFPGSFSNTPESRQLVQELREAYPDVALVVEVRHRSWLEAAGLDLLKDAAISLASIDLPQGRNTLPPGDELTNPALGYVRLHGRNAAAWFDRKAGRDQRYDYLYDAQELEEWGARIDGLARRAERTLVIANNHFRGQAPANALELRAMREGPVAVPPPLRASYERLGRISS